MSFIKNCRNIYCIGRNFADHAKELNNPVPKSPVVFMKPTSSFCQSPSNILVPPSCSNLHHEIELCVIIGKGGRDIAFENSMDHVSGYFLGLDMTARELQDQAKKAGLPWTISKGYDTFAAVGDFIPTSSLSDTSKARLWLKVNDQIRQDGSTSMMLFTIPQLISYLSSIFTLQEGDCIFTGTPAGVSSVIAGDVITAGLVDEVTQSTVSEIKFTIANRAQL